MHSLMCDVKGCNFANKLTMRVEKLFRAQWQRPWSEKCKKKNPLTAVCSNNLDCSIQTWRLLLLWLCSGFQVMNMHYCACVSCEDRKQIVWRFGYPVLLLPLATGSLLSGIQWIPKQRDECGETEEWCSICISAAVPQIALQCTLNLIKHIQKLYS